MIDWLRVFPDSDFRFRIGLRRADGQEFFAAEPGREERIGLRCVALESHPERYAGALEGSGEAIAEAGAWMGGGSLEAAAPQERCVEIGRRVDADWVLLAGDAARHHPVIAGCVCFPSHWSLPEKLGQAIERVHQPVPTLAATLDASIHTFLSRLRAGDGWERDNWGLAADARLNRHPAAPGEPLGSDAGPADTWLRLERQYLTRLAASDAVLFAIKVTTHPLSELIALPELAPRIVRTLRTMSGEIARYKGLADCCGQLAGRIESAAPGGSSMPPIR